MEKIDLKAVLPALYNAPRGRFVIVDVPPMSYLAVEGEGDPNTSPAYEAAIETLYAASYTLKFLTKAAMGRDYVVPPLEGLWWADDMDDFVTRRKDRWRWRMMIATPDFIDAPVAMRAIEKARAKGKALEAVSFERLEEGRSVQALHVGAYDEEGPALEALHKRFLPANGLTPAGLHHEIYLNDPRRTPAEKLRTLLRQPVRAVA
ncbi:GyrI-like domain-containing protein [Caulobacter sp.]|uniref:GyrI-like domain-containing protein n=1 Tax=Caulobacter sp. TaxID=78 RepID=UPI001B1823CC|nr:GyrI-like domain-containing protein [Caulobacter sp.]MBO9544335.1 GyrI-like domain-containing protein [Caulobacter sp.]